MIVPVIYLRDVFEMFGFWVPVHFRSTYDKSWVRVS